MAQTSARTPGTIVNQTGAGSIAWSNPGNAATDNNQYATAVFPGFSSGANTNWLKATNFGFDSEIPSDASSINGVNVIWWVNKNSNFGVVTQTANRLVIGGTIQSTDRLNTTEWTTTETGLGSGNSTDLWGTTPSVANVRDSGFGVAMRAINNSSSGVTGQVDYVTMTVWYTPAARTGTIAVTIGAVVLSGSATFRHPPFIPSVVETLKRRRRHRMLNLLQPIGLEYASLHSRA